MISNTFSKKILTVSIDPSCHGGIASVVNTLAEYYEPFYFLPSSSDKNIFNKIYILLKCLLRIPFYHFFKGVSIIHIHTASYKSFTRKSLIVMLAKVLRMRIVLHIHGAGFQEFYDRYNKFNIIYKILSMVDVNIVLSESWKRYFQEEVGLHNIEIVHNTIHHHPSSVNKVQNHHRNLINFLFLGEIGKRKGAYDLLEVIIENKNFLKGKIKVHIGGNGEVDILKKIIKDESLEEIISFEGWVTGEEKSKLLELCDVYVLPSYHEGLPISILEAMSYGMPVISTTVGGIPEVVKNNVNGFTIEPGDKKSLLDSILYFIHNTEEIKRMGSNSSQTVEQFYPEAVIPKLESIYSKLLK